MSCIYSQIAVMITAMDPDHPAYHFAMTHPEIFVPVEMFMATMGSDVVYEGDAPIPAAIVDRLRKARAEELSK